jgi:hypothetical protein
VLVTCRFAVKDEYWYETFDFIKAREQCRVVMKSKPMAEPMKTGFRHLKAIKIIVKLAAR